MKIYVVVQWSIKYFATVTAVNAHWLHATSVFMNKYEHHLLAITKVFLLHMSSFLVKHVLKVNNLKFLCHCFCQAHESISYPKG